MFISYIYPPASNSGKWRVYKDPVLKAKFPPHDILPETNRLPLKFYCWKMNFPFGMAYVLGLGGYTS